MPLPQTKTFDPSQVTGNYFAARGARKAEDRQNVLDRQRATTSQNAFADRERRISREDEEAVYKKRMRKISEDKQWRDQGKEMAATIDTNADDATFQEQVSRIPDALGARMSDLGYEPNEISQTIKRVFQSGLWSKQGVKATQKKLGVGPAAPRTSTAYADLEATLGRKPTAKELREHKAKAGSGQMPSDAKMVEYLVANKIAPDRKNAYSMVQMSKSDPVKLVSGLVSSAEEAQKAAMLMPGDDGFKDRQTLIKEAQQTVMDIRKAFTSEAQGGAQEYTPKHVPGGADPRMGNMGGGSAAPAPAAPVAAGSEPVPQTQEDFAALPPGTLYRDPDDNKLYRK